MAYLWRGVKARVRRLKCSAYVGSCSLCAEWKREQAAKQRTKRATALKP